MSYKGKYIVVGIDGTDSHEWMLPNGSNSHVNKFVKDFKAPIQDRAYYYGPVGAFGKGTESRLNEAIQFINKRIRYHFPNLTPSKDLLRIILVGHSRGGLIAINLAKKISFPIFFMGLFDAVDRYIGLSGEKITNVQYTYHALRDSTLRSRSEFGNTGEGNSNTCKSHSGHNYCEKLFFTSHGGIGGAPDFEPDRSFFSFSDFSCDNQTLKGGIYAMQGINLEKICSDNSKAAGVWMREKARIHKLPI